MGKVLQTNERGSLRLHDNEKEKRKEKEKGWTSITTPAATRTGPGWERECSDEDERSRQHRVQ